MWISHGSMSQASEYQHIPVLMAEVMESLDVKTDGDYIDCTLGGGGHACAILNKLGPKGRFFGLDQDKEALAAAENRIRAMSPQANWQLASANFKDLAAEMDRIGWTAADGILADIGVSSWQIDQPDRGFTFRQEGPLDMRMNQNAPCTAADIVNHAREEDLVRILRDYGEERYARRISHAIVMHRQKSPFRTTTELADLIIKAMPSSSRREDQHPARRTFQALRIEVNGELDALRSLLESAPARLRPHGRLAIITFHSLEDRLVKDAFRKLENPCTCPRDFPVCVCGRKPLGRVVYKRGLTAGDDEIRQNPRAASARVRCFERLTDEEVANG